jgi:hypothetical protein
MKTKNVVLATLAAAMLVGAAAPASFAAPGRGGHDGPGKRAMMQEMTFIRLLKNADTDKDGKITKGETTAYQEALFTEIDTDKDENLIPGELRAFRKARMEEFRKENPRPHRAERREQREERRQQMAENGERDRDDRENRRHGHRWGGHGPRMAGLHFVRQADTDENGQYSKAEVTTAADKLFTRMDRNKDGVISIDDMPDRPF